MKGEEQQALKVSVVRMLLEAVYALAHFFAPFVPMAAEAIFTKVGTPPMAIPDLQDNFSNLKTGTQVVAESVLFEAFDAAEGSAAAAASAAPKAAAAKGAPAAKGAA